MYIGAIVRPFLYNITPIQAKKMIDELPHASVKNLIFKKGLVNILPAKVSTTLKNNAFEPDTKPAHGLNALEMASHSGSTKSDELAKLHHKEEMLSLHSSEDGSANRFTIKNRSSFGNDHEMHKMVSGEVKIVKNQNSGKVGNSKFINFDDDVTPKMSKLPDPVVQNFVIEEEKFDHLPR